jgi:hypothetical protein
VETDAICDCCLYVAGSLGAFASDTTWYCSALITKTDKKPTAFKFPVNGNELIDFQIVVESDVEGI